MARSSASIAERNCPFDPIRDAAETRVFDPNQYMGESYPQDQQNNDFNDSYENYYDGEDDQTFMDRMDNRFRRNDDDEDRPPKKSSKTWLWITLGVLAAVSNKPTALPTTVATVKPTEKATEKPTEAPKPTKSPETKAPETQAPATQAPETEAPPITEAPKPTEPPVTPTDPPAPTEAETLVTQ